MDVAIRLIPFFLLIAVGALAARTRRIDLAGARALAAYVFWIAFPALLINKLSAMPFPDGRTLLSLGVMCVVLLILAGVVIAVGAKLRWRREAILAVGAASMAANIPFLAAPFALSVLGPSASWAVSAVMAADGLVIVAGVATLLKAGTGNQAWGMATLSSLLNPLVFAAGVGAILSYFQIQIGGPPGQAVALLAATASPVGLVGLGVVVGLEFGKPEAGDTAPVALAILAKLILAPALVWTALSLTGADPVLRAAATLMSASPVAVHVYVQTRARDVFSRGGAQVVVISTLIAMISLSLWAAFALASVR